MRKVIVAAAVALTAAVSTNAALAQAPGGVKVATVSAAVVPLIAHSGGKGTVLVTVIVSPHFHINAHRPNDPDLIPTTLTMGKAGGISFGAPVFPASMSVKVGYEKKPMLVYTGRAVFRVPFTVSKSAKPGRQTLAGSLGYQGCNATSCYPPTNAIFRADLTIK
jgi:hypothetical protein